MTEDFERVHPTRISSLLQGDWKKGEEGSVREEASLVVPEEDGVSRNENEEDRHTVSFTVLRLSKRAGFHGGGARC